MKQKDIQLSEIRFAIVGAGRIGMRHAEKIQEVGKLTAFCDTDPEKRSFVSSQFGIKAFKTINDMFEEVENIDVVAICTPNGLHKEHTVSCLNANAHVICEKPMALSSSDCQEMIDCAKERQRHLFVVKQNRFNPPIVKLKEAIDRNKFGKILSVQLNCFWNRGEDYYINDPWKGTKLLDGGSLYTQFSHFLDLLLWLVGPIESVQAMHANFLHDDIEFEDCGAAIMKFKNGAIGGVSFTLNSFRKNMEGSITLFGELGTAKIGGQYLNEVEYEEFEDFSFGSIEAGNGANEYGHYQGSMSNHLDVYKNVVDVLSDKASVATTGAEGKATVELIETIYANAMNN